MSRVEQIEGAKALAHIPYNVFATEISGTLKKDFFAELEEIFKSYKVYKRGSSFVTEGASGDYIPSDTRYKKAKTLIDKEARFLFSITPTFTINENASGTSADKQKNTLLNDFLNTVLEKNSFSDKLLKAAKDCFIGKRVACMINFSEESGISIAFLNSMEFMYEMSGDSLIKLVAIYTLTESSDRRTKRVKKKSYKMIEGVCHVEEIIYDGLGTVVETLIEEQSTEFTMIPAFVIFNDGLTNDATGESEISLLEGYESKYSKLANADIDAERKSMNPIRYTIDASAESTKSLSSAPGSFWDILSDSDGEVSRTAQVGLMEAGMTYSSALKTTLDRIDSTMHAQLDVPNLDSEQLQGVITSGKTLKALYWGLLVRCNEKMLAWRPALEYMSRVIITGALLYPESTEAYTSEPIPEIEYEVSVENNYPLPEDEQEEKTMDLSEIANMTLSRRSYMKKWRSLTDKEVDEELRQIAIEKQLFEEGYISDMSSTEGSLDGNTSLDDKSIS